MPGFEFLRFAAQGPVDARETAQKCNAIGESASRAMAALEARVATLETLIVELRVAAQGSMTLATPVAGPDITGTYQPITFYDTVPYERGATVNTTTGEFTFNTDGDWALFYRIAINHGGSGARRTLNVRSFNVTTATAGPTSNLFIGSNQEDTSDTLMLPFAVTSGQVGQSFRLDIGNASANITGVTWNSSNVLLLFVGELGSLIP